MNKFKNKIITVTGGSGFIGSNLCDEIIKLKPKQLIIIDNLCQSDISNIKHLLKHKNVKFVKVDIRDYESIETHILNSNYVFHLAAGNVGMGDIYPRVNLQSNIDGTFNVLSAIKKSKKAKLIYSSSGSIAEPSTIYAISKLAAENLVNFFIKEHNIKATIIRYYHVYGERQHPKAKSGVVNIFLDKVLRGQRPEIWGNGKAKKNFTYIKDVIYATLLVAFDKETNGNTYDCASDDKVTINELADIVIETCENKKIKPIHTKEKVGEIMELFPNTLGLNGLGWEQIYTLNDGINLCKKWVKNNLNK